MDNFSSFLGHTSGISLPSKENVMQYFSQLNPKWANDTYYNGFTFKSYGCLVCSLAMLCDIEPPEVARILRDNGCFTSSGMLISDQAANALGLEYNGISSYQKPDYPCVAETLYYDKVSTPAPEQHFFVIFPDGQIWDPLGTNINYPIKSYRLFKPLETEFNMDSIKGMVTNHVIQFYLEMRGVAPTQAELDPHVNSIMAAAKGDNPNNALSDWDGRMFQEQEWTEHYKSLCPFCQPTDVCDCSQEVKAEQDRIINNLIK